MKDTTNKLLYLMKNGFSKILKESLVGVYLHGSYAFGTYTESVSDLDFFIVVHEGLSVEDKGKILDYTIEVLYPLAPKKGLEFHVLQLKHTMNPNFPMTFDLHFSDVHYAAYLKDKNKFIQTMIGIDNDLPAHMVVTKLYGRVLIGEPIDDVFGSVREDIYFKSIVSDIEEAEVDILENPMYVGLNLCRVLAFKKAKIVLSKEGGGEWAIKSLPHKYHSYINLFLNEYKGVEVKKDDYQKINLLDFSRYMLANIYS